jgi:hypothetical protein
MKRNLIGTLSLVVLALLISFTGPFAQASAKANVPFAFAVGSAQLPAGTYEIKTVGQGNSSVVIQNDETSAAAMSTAGREQPRNTSAKLVFHRVGNAYFLAEVWRSSTAEGMIIPTSKQEKELEKELRAANGHAGGYEEVVIALN